MFVLVFFSKVFLGGNGFQPGELIGCQPNPIRYCLFIVGNSIFAPFGWVFINARYLYARGMIAVNGNECSRASTEMAVASFVYTVEIGDI